MKDFYIKALPLWHFLILGLNTMSFIKGIENGNNSQFWFSGVVSFLMLGLITAEIQNGCYKLNKQQNKNK